MVPINIIPVTRSFLIIHYGIGISKFSIGQLYDRSSVTTMTDYRLPNYHYGRYQSDSVSFQQKMAVEIDKLMDEDDESLIDEEYEKKCQLKELVENGYYDPFRIDQSDIESLMKSYDYS